MTTTNELQFYSFDPVIDIEFKYFTVYLFYCLPYFKKS